MSRPVMDMLCDYIRPDSHVVCVASPSPLGITIHGRGRTTHSLFAHPDHLANIISRDKNHEYRKYRLKDGVVRLWLYETAGGGGRASITHIAIIPSSIRHEPGSVPTEPPGIGNAKFNAGLKQSKFGYPILELYELFNPVTLSEMKTR
ncbi:hypothetical protein CEP53_007379 [Fusarium sp. AF-6]|nr:hypothetical protein CEP53_007379 [Fusarium sp. AF-6]